MKNHSQLCLKVADLSVRVSSCDPSLKLEAKGAIQDFLAGADQPDARVTVAWSDLSDVNLGSKVFDSSALWKLYRHNGWQVYSFTSSVLGPVPYKVASFNSTFTRGEISLHREYFEPEQPLYPLEYPLDELWMVNVLSQGRGAEVHSCGLIDEQGEGHLFVGQSRAGKSTMARLWQEKKTAQVLSDDRIVLRRSGRQLWMYGTPWHGEAGLSAATRAPLSGIYFLQHGPANQLLPVSAAQAVGRLFACSFPTFHSPEGLDFMLGFLEEVVQAAPCFDLRFLPDPEVIEFVLEGRSKSRGGTP